VEIEAKFTIPDEGTFQRLLAAPALGRFDLASPALLHVRDRYLDTPTGDIHAAGYACRLRREGDRFLVGVKGLGGVSGALHRRAEHEQPISRPLPPADWPPGPVRDLVLPLSGGQPLICLFEVEQARHTRSILDAGRALAQLSFDRIDISREGVVAAHFLELEAELQAAGQVRDLERLASQIEEDWGLSPQSRSKFERGLDLFDLSSAPQGKVAR
jgi:inorganic triphosphatase YgiF